MRTIEDQVRKTYFSLRFTAAVIAFAFPVILYFGGRFAGINLQDSLSAYYHAVPGGAGPSKAPCKQTDPSAPVSYPEAGFMRNWFVGLLFSIGAVLHANKGHTDRENWLLSIAGLFAWCIALFPMPWFCRPPGPVSPHGASAIAFFVSIAIVSIFFSETTVSYLRPKRQHVYRALYRIWGSLMVISPVASYFLIKHAEGPYIFWAEVAGIYAFGLYWVTTTFEIKEIEAERGSAFSDARSIPQIS